MDAGAGKKVRLSIVPCQVKGGRVTVVQGTSFETMLNPSSYKHALSISYNEKTAPGKSSLEAKFNASGGDSVSFKLFIDGTGVVEPVTANNSVTDRIQTLRKIVHDYDGEKHEPSVVRILWGSFIFYGRLKSMTLNYTLFKPSGEPLRAEVDLAFVGTMGSKEEALRAKRSSPDLTHVVEFKAGDSLPLLCYQIYEDSAYYAAVARYNHITNFRAIKPGQKLIFPPLR